MFRASSAVIVANSAATSAVLSSADVVPDKENTLRLVFALFALLSDMTTFTTVPADNLLMGYDLVILYFFLEKLVCLRLPDSPPNLEFRITVKIKYWEINIWSNR